MRRRVLTVSEARRNLPALIREAAQGGGPYYLGARGRVEAVLVSAAQYGSSQPQAVTEGIPGWEGLRLELVGSFEDLERDIREIRQDVVQAAMGRLDTATGPPTKTKRRRKRVTAR